LKQQFLSRTEDIFRGLYLTYEELKQLP